MLLLSNPPLCTAQPIATAASFSVAAGTNTTLDFAAFVSYVDGQTSQLRVFVTLPSTGVLYDVTTGAPRANNTQLGAGVTRVVFRCAAIVAAVVCVVFGTCSLSFYHTPHQAGRTSCHFMIIREGVPALQRVVWGY